VHIFSFVTYFLVLNFRFAAFDAISTKGDNEVILSTLVAVAIL